MCFRTIGMALYTWGSDWARPWSRTCERRASGGAAGSDWLLNVSRSIRTARRPALIWGKCPRRYEWQPRTLSPSGELLNVTRPLIEAEAAWPGKEGKDPQKTFK